MGKSMSEVVCKSKSIMTGFCADFEQRVSLNKTYLGG